MRRLVLLATLLLLAPGPVAAAATGWGEAPAIGLGAGEVATCLRDAGGGRVAALAESHARFGAALYAVGPDGLRADGEALLGRRLDGCPAVAATGSGAAVVAAAVRSRSRRSPVRLRVGVRDAGGGFAPPVELATVSSAPTLIEPTVAIGADGTMVVAWREQLVALRTRRRPRVRSSVRVAVRPAGGGFGPVRTLVDRALGADLQGVPLAVGVDAGGAVTAAWTHPLRPQRDRRGTVEGLASVEVATAAPGRAFGPPQRLQDEAQDVATLALAVAPGGRALLAHDGNERVLVYERAGGAGAFAPGRTAGGDPSDSASQPAVALAADGGAVVAWRAGDAVDAVARTAPGGFGPVQRIQPQADTGPFDFALAETIGGAPEDSGDSRPRASAAPGGRAAIAWLVARDPLRRPASARVASAAGGAFSPATVLGGPVLDADGVVPWLGAGGRAAVWSENRTRVFAGTYPVGDGRLRVAQAARPPASPPAPTVRLAARPQALYHDDPLIVDARCAAACDLRATIAPRSSRRDGSRPGAALATGGRADPGPVHLRVEPVLGSPLAPPGGGTVRVRVVAAAPGGIESSRTVVEARVTRRAPPPFYPPLDVRARRAGDAVIVTWRTAGPARRTLFAAYTRRTRGRRPTPASAFAWRAGRGDRRFRLRVEDAGSARWVLLLAVAKDPPTRFERVVVPVAR